MKYLPRSIIKDWYIQEYNKADEFSIYGQPPHPLMRFFKLLHERKTKNALELGCGDGRNLIELARVGIDATGIDFAGKDAANLRADQQKQKIKFIEANLESYNFSDQAYDAIICSEVMHLLTGEINQRIFQEIEQASHSGTMIYISILSNLKRKLRDTGEEFGYEREPNYSSKEAHNLLNKNFSYWNIVDQGEFHDEQDWPLNPAFHSISPYHWSGDYVYIIAEKP